MAIYKFNLENVSLAAVAPSQFAALGVKEREHLQRALKNNIEVIAPGTLVLTEEFGRWEDAKRRIDLLCLDKDRQLVVVELKRTDDGGHLELQALRYAAMVSAMTFQQAVAAHAAYLANKGTEGSTAEARVREFLDAPEGPITLSTKVRIVLASADFSREITTTVLWLNSQGLDVTCVRLQPLRVGGYFVIDVQQVIPLPEAQAYQIAIRDKANQQEKAEASGRDFTKYEVTTSFGTSTGLPKRRFMFEVVREAIKHGITPEKINEAVPWRRTTMFLKAPGLLKAGELMEQFADKNPARYFSDDEELFHVNDYTYAMSNQWGLSTEDAARNVIQLLPAGAVTFLALTAQE
ncbi:hypothetical protein [Ramlibacter sp. Leaf400]|uniref:hypothetical protein n=1 Tax=Ramlibacter sp. Leaf400 TaxID=1736365 RepID=UPI0006FD5368|nr:hypothetical protein [Ramlibacter sp. Leaf400]KQT13277.1 hypothetical protein ASG30_20155 [Ramlibacter sp. Leaf400]